MSFKTRDRKSLGSRFSLPVRAKRRDDIEQLGRVEQKHEGTKNGLLRNAEN